MKNILMILSVLVVVSIGFSAVSADTDGAIQAARVAELELTRDTLKADLTQIASEKSRCEKQKKNWKTATIVGGVGVAATATGAIIQHSNNKTKKDERDDLKDQLGQKEKDLKALQDKMK